jgi:soluble lytic murein transglycosylase-like protein
MDLAIIPGVLLAIMLIFGSSGQPPTSTGAPAKVVVLESFDDHPTLDVEIESADETDYSVIYSFITKTYTRIPTEDAVIISRSLVTYGTDLKIDPKFVAALFSRESSFNKTAISSTGAKGLGQIKDFNFPSLKINDPFDIDQNTRGSMTYIKQMLSLWKTESKKTSLALASYFRGYSTINKANKKADAVTKNYVRDIILTYDTLKQMKATSLVAPNSNSGQF